MPLDIGDRIGPYQITALLGEGGMGKVFRARDSRLNRDVAIKVVSEAFAGDPERLARFTREAQTLAALSHPNIAAIYGIEESGDTRALVMELVEGEDLSDLISARPAGAERGVERAINIDDAIPIARQLADALAAAHDLGIVHRDLKPANIKVKSDGSIKVLDFGLAKALAPDGASATAGHASNSPTLTARATAMGMILGTAAYMAPEQARGKSVDQRADIWAFGVVLFEMLTGRRLFKGDEVTDVLAAVLRQDVDWTELPADVPPSIRRLLRRCLEKDPRKRLSSIADARLELDEVEAPIASSAPAASVLPAKRSWFGLLWPAAAGAVITAVVMLATRPAPPPSATSVTRTSVLAPNGVEIYPDSSAVVISPDGTMVAFVVGNFTDRDSQQIWIRKVDSLTATKLEGTEGAFLPFWKPDSTRIGFFAGRKLKTVSVTGGHVEVIATAEFGRGGAWNQSDVIVFAGDASGTLSRVSAGGGDATPLTTLDAGRKESAHRFPVFLPDGDHFLYAALPGREGKFNILASSLSRPSQATLVAAIGNMPAFAPSSSGQGGSLLYGRQGVLVAQPFDTQALKTTGDATVLVDEPSVILDPQISYTAGPVTSVSATGALAYYSASSTNTRVVWLDATGKIGGTLAVKPGNYSAVRISPDGTQAVLVRSVSVTESSLWLVDLARATTTALSTGGGRNDSPVWSLDGTRVVFSSDRTGPQDFFVKTVADSSPEQPFYKSEVMFKTPTSFTPDGKSILFHQIMPATAYDVYSIAATGQGAPTLVATGPLRELGAVPSPTGQAIAFLAEEAGRMEVYVQPFPQGGRRVPVSANGASRGWWSRDGRSMLYLGSYSRELWRVDVETGGAAIRAGAPVHVATLPPGLSTLTIDAMPDRQRFLALLPDQIGVPSITIVQGWQGAVKSRGR